MLIMIDNYDSFSHILADYLRRLGEEVFVFRNDVVTLEEIEILDPWAIIISPGPGDPDGAGITLPVVKYFSGKIPLLGVCLGHQAIGQIFGGKVIRAPRLMHGKTSNIIHNNKGLFREMPNPFVATRYHSLILDPEVIPSELEVTAHTEMGEIMAIRHRSYLVEGVQFHPESILTHRGTSILRNFLDLASSYYLQTKEGNYYATRR